MWTLFIESWLKAWKRLIFIYFCRYFLKGFGTEHVVERVVGNGVSMIDHVFELLTFEEFDAVIFEEYLVVFFEFEGFFYLEGVGRGFLKVERITIFPD
jgi:hypothetical protein